TPLKTGAPLTAPADRPPETTVIKNSEAHTNGAPAVPNRLAMNRLGPQKGSTAPPVKRTAEVTEQGDDIAQNRLIAKKLAEEKARCRLLAQLPPQSSSR